MMDAMTPRHPLRSRPVAALFALAAITAPLVSSSVTAQSPALTSGLDAAAFDRTVRPQDDLFRYVNGGWLTRTEIPADRARYGGFTEAFDRTQLQLKALVEAAAERPGPAGAPRQKIGDFYTAFIDEARVNQLGVAPLAPELARIDAIASKADLARYFARQLKLGVGGTPIQGGVEGDAQEPTRSVLYVFQSGLGLPDRDYYLKDDAKLKDIRAKYEAYVATMLEGA
jgi:predicted metalloendopeptidase